jgi:acyl dehydratase
LGINAALEGREYPPSAVYEVSREKIAEFATAIGSDDPVHVDPEAARALGYLDVVAPPTFAVVIAQRSESQVYSDPDAGVDFSRVVHGEERFVHQRPIVVGDRLTAVLHVETAREVGSHGLLSTRVEIVDAEGRPVSTVRSTVVVRGEA